MNERFVEENRWLIWCQISAFTGIHIPVEEVPLAIDELPAVLITAACAESVTVLSGAEELR